MMFDVISYRVGQSQEGLIKRHDDGGITNPATIANMLCVAPTNGRTVIVAANEALALSTEVLDQGQALGCTNACNTTLLRPTAFVDHFANACSVTNFCASAL